MRRGRRLTSSASSSGSRAATIAGQRTVVIFHGIEQGGVEVVSLFLFLRGKKRGSSGRHAVQDQSEQQLRVQPRQDRVVAVVGQAVKAADGFPPLERQLDLPSEAIQRQTHCGGHAGSWHCRKYDDVL